MFSRENINIIEYEIPVKSNLYILYNWTSMIQNFYTI